MKVPPTNRILDVASSLICEEGEEDVNPEYDRAIAEMTRDILGLDTDEYTVPFTLNVLRFYREVNA